MAAKNIVLCSDGTGNSDTKGRGTNVFKLYEAVDIHGHKFDPSLNRQIAFYDDGVGTENFALQRIIGAAFGYGFAQNIRDLYLELVHVYVPGDKLFLFGFSRGAYTIRALGGMIQYCGVLQRDSDRFKTEADLKAGVKVCWKAFEKAAFPRFITDKKRRAGKASPDTEAPKRREQLGSYPDPVEIEFVGVWDTVGAVGMPIDELKLLVNWICPRKFGELTPGPHVRRACHALSIDDERRTFKPELWNETDALPGQVEQVWFAGVHSNVGGGYPKQGLSLVTLDWMMSEVKEHGLRFIPAARDYIRAQQDVHDRLYDSRAGYAVYYRWDPRNIAKICKDHGIKRPKIHASVFERIACTTDGYAPGNIPANLEITDTRSMPSRPQQIGKAQDTIRAELQKLQAESLQSLPDMRRWTWVGYLSYYGFLFLTIAAIYWVSPPAQGLSLVEQATTIGKWLLGLVTSLTAMWDVATRLAVTWWFLPGLITCYLVSLLVDNRMERCYSGFWHKIRSLIDPWRVQAQEDRGGEQ